MMDFKTLVENLTGLSAPEANYIEESSNRIANLITSRELTSLDFVKEIDSVLTNGSYEIRSRGVSLLSHVVITLPKDHLVEKEIDCLSEFLCLRLLDHSSMEMSALACLSYFVDCVHKPHRYNKQLLEFLSGKTKVGKMGQPSRYMVYTILKKILIQRRQVSQQIDTDLIYSLVRIIEGENNPKNLLHCFGIVHYVMKNFTDLEPFIDDLFEWLGSYYPVDYTPRNNDDADAIKIRRSDLIQALYDCFFANPLNADSLLTLLLEKVDSNILSSKLESLKCLIRSFEEFPLDRVKNYGSTLWTAIRVNCLKKLESVEQDLLNLSYKALTAFTTNLSQDDELYFNFVSDMYEELAIAFRKPEMDLFEPAACLLTHAAIPKLMGFSYILEKIIPVTLNALASNELRPIPGLAYIFEKLNNAHPGSNLKPDLDLPIEKLIDSIIDFIAVDKNCNRLMNAIIQKRVTLKEQQLAKISETLYSKFDSSLDVEESLALICIHYNRLDIVSGAINGEPHLEVLMQLADCFRNLDATETTRIFKFAVFLRIVLIQLDRGHPKVIEAVHQETLQTFLSFLRSSAEFLHEHEKLINKIGQIHAIVFNKLSSEAIRPLVMEVFNSSYCQNLVPTNSQQREFTKKVYLPVLTWIFKSLFVRNHPLAEPMVNLLLNLIASDEIDLDLALSGCRVFSFMQEEESLDFFDSDKNYQKFALYKQKFYMLSSKESKTRYPMLIDNNKKALILCTIALQVPNLPVTIYRKDYEWLIRELLRSLSTFKNFRNNDTNKTDTAGMELLNVVYGCLESLIGSGLNTELSKFIESIVRICLEHAKEVETFRVRMRALVCLGNLASSLEDTDLLSIRSNVIDQLRVCLVDKKRLVRQAAAEARLKWVLVGQPIGSLAGTS